MDRYVIKLMSTLSVALFLIAGSAQASDWQFLKTKKDVKVYKKEVPGSPLVAFKGIMVMPTPIAKVAQVLLDTDTETKKQWIDMIEEFRVLEEGDYYGVSYSSYGLPWPLADRDYVVRSELVIDNQKNQVTVELKSVDHPKAPATSGVRATLIGSRYLLQPMGEDKTLVTVEIQTDPKGMLPSWLVNLIQADWPSNTLSALAEQAAKPGIIDHPLVKKELQSLRRYSANP